MSRMITYPELPLDHLSYPRGRPNLPTKPESFGPLHQQGWQLRPLLRTQFWLCSWWGLMTQRLNSLRFGLADPLTHRSFGHSYGCGDVFLFPSLLIQFPSAQASSLAPIFRKRCACTHTSFYRLVAFRL